ncbi:serine hydrolase [Phenylobacterium deserti]|uniref:serine hydrolase n=1 Tax=Phenylobacterium deserti TaxID=1914756 RepID=UPI00140335D4|nr:serine hydrolase [Phenylobacterium deserti]
MRRPRTALLAGLALTIAAAGCGWVTITGLEKGGAVQLTSAPAQAKPPPAPPAPAELQARLTELAEDYREDVGIAVTDVTERWTASVDGGSLYPQQSVVKIWVALAMMEAIDQGRFRLDQPVLVRPEDRSVFYEPLGRKIGRTGFLTTYYDLLSRSLTESDNTANDKIMSEVGGAAIVTDVVARKGLTGIGIGGDEKMLQSLTAGVEWRPELVGWRFKEARAKLPDEVRDRALDAYLANPPDGATPIGLTHGLAALQRGELLSKPSTDTLIGLMAEAKTGNLRLKAGLPPGWSIAHKTGTGPDWRGASVGINDVGLITAPDGRVYAVAVMLRETKRPFRDRQRLMQQVARAVADHWQQRGGGAAPV